MKQVAHENRNRTTDAPPKSEPSSVRLKDRPSNVEDLAPSETSRLPPEDYYLSRHDREAIASHRRSRSRLEAQVAAERPAFVLADARDDEAPTPLIRLVADLIGEEDANDIEGSTLGALADDLDALHAAITDDQGMLHARFDHARLPTMIWRLANRARAAREIASRQRAVERMVAGASAAGSRGAS